MSSKIEHWRYVRNSGCSPSKWLMCLRQDGRALVHGTAWRRAAKQESEVMVRRDGSKGNGTFSCTTGFHCDSWYMDTSRIFLPSVLPSLSCFIYNYVYIVTHRYNKVQYNEIFDITNCLIFTNYNALQTLCIFLSLYHETSSSAIPL